MDSKLFDLNSFNYAVYRNTKSTSNVNINSLYSKPSKDEFLAKFKNPDNIDYLINQINLLNNNKLNRNTIYINLIKYINAWENMGKFDNLPNSISIINLLDSYNNLFIKVFGNTFGDNSIVPFNIKQSPSDLNGMYAQQTRYMDYSSDIKPISSYRKSVFKRHYDTYRETDVNDRQGMFYAMDNNKFTNQLNDMDITDDKTSDDSYIEREMPLYKLK